MCKFIKSQSILTQKELKNVSNTPLILCIL